MSRLPTVSYDALSSEDRAIWNRIAAHRTGMAGPYSVLMHVPALADRVAALEDYFRFNASLPAIDKELVILATAREVGAHYPWTRHERRAREAHMRAELLEALRANGPVEGMTPRERLLVEIARSLLRARGLPQDLFERALNGLGRQQLIEVVALVGHYNLIGNIVNAFDVKAPEGSRTF